MYYLLNVFVSEYGWLTLVEKSLVIEFNGYIIGVPVTELGFIRMQLDNGDHEKGICVVENWVYLCLLKLEIIYAIFLFVKYFLTIDELGDFKERVLTLDSAIQTNCVAMIGICLYLEALQMHSAQTKLARLSHFVAVLLITIAILKHLLSAYTANSLANI